MGGPKGRYHLKATENCLDCVMRDEGAFCKLPHGALATLNSIRGTSYYPRGAILFVEGGTPRGVFVLCSGQAKLTANSADGHSLTLRTIEPGEAVGLSNVVDDYPYAASAETLCSSQVSFIPRLEFLRFLRSNPDVSIRVARHLSYELRQAWKQSRMVALAPDAHAKLAQFLIERAAKQVQTVADNLCIALNMTHEEISRHIGASRESVSRILKDFRNRGVISIMGGTIMVSRPDELRRLAAAS